MAADAEQRQHGWKSINDGKQDLYSDYTIDEPTQELFGEHCMLLHEFREVVQARSWKGSVLPRNKMGSFSYLWPMSEMRIPIRPLHTQATAGYT